MRALPDAFIAAIVKLAQEAPLIWLFEIQLDTSYALRITPYLRSVTWPTAGGHVYEPFPLLFDSITASSEADTSTLLLTVPNVDRQLMPSLISYDGLTDRVVLVHLVSKETLAETTALRFDYEIATSAASTDVLTFELGAAELFEMSAPIQHYSRWYCGWRFGDSWTCGFDCSRTGASQTCARTWAACLEKGLEEERANLKNLHPRRARIFAGIPLTD
ncbi:MAG: hypothetical protein JXQ29_18605 [Planctomycetes bacterium]|nr:hypothetical protein [Planctomycetota bacterium]